MASLPPPTIITFERREPAGSQRTPKENTPRGSKPKSSSVKIEEESEKKVKRKRSRRRAVRGHATISNDSIVSRIVGLATNLIPVAMITLGIVNMNNCPREQMIPIWLVVGGSLYIISSIIDISVCFRKDMDRPLPIRVIDHVLVAVMLFWLVPGSVWVYEVHKDVVYTEGNEMYCNKATYVFTFTLITATYCCLGLITITLLLIGGVVTCFG